MPTTSFSFSDALRARERVNRTLIPVRFFQQGVYGNSFEEQPDNEFDSRVDRLAEKFTSLAVNGKHDPQTGWDVVRPDGTKIEVRYRSLSFPTKDDSSNKVSMTWKELEDKTAEELFLYVYNPSLKSVDLFIYPKKIYKEGVTVRYSTARQDYTSSGGGTFRVDREKVKPEVVRGNHLLQYAKESGFYLTGKFSESEIARITKFLNNEKISFL